MTFTTVQQASSSSIESQLTGTSGADPARPKSYLEITAHAALPGYERRRSSGGSLIVLPNHEIPHGKDQHSIVVRACRTTLPDAEYIRYPGQQLFGASRSAGWAISGEPRSRKQQFQMSTGSGTFRSASRQNRSSMPVRLELVGKEKIQVRGNDRDLMCLNLKGEDFDCAFGSMNKISPSSYHTSGDRGRQQAKLLRHST